MENKDIAIKISGLRKMYKLGQIGGGTLQGDIQSWWAKVRGKEDPNSKIGEKRLTGKTFMALNGIDLTIKKGEAVGIIGHNGAGKSTLLKLLCRVTAPTEGEICINGRIASMLEVGTGFNGEMTGRENVYMNGAILGMTRAEVDAKMEQIIEFSEVRDFIDTPVKRYSSGMYVKLAFSVAAHLDSEIMIMDEVLAVGDVNFQQKCLSKMKSLAENSGKTVLYVSHNMSTIKQLCDRCIVLEQGKVVFEGDVDDAIAVYSAKNDLLIEKEYDVSNFKRLDGITGICHLNTVVVPQSEIDLDGTLNFRLMISSKQELRNSILRFVVFNSVGSTIGTSYSIPYDISSGYNDIPFCFTAQGLMPGKYTVDVILCQFENGIQTRHDIVIHGFSFIVNENERFFNMKWNANGWGAIKFPNITIGE